MLCESLDIVEHYQKFAEAFGVSDELNEFASFDRVEAALIAEAAANAKLLAEIKQKKDLRRESIDRNMLGIIEVVAHSFEISADEIMDIICDSVIKTECLHHFFRQNGSETLIFSFTPKSNDANRIFLLHEKEYHQTDQCAIVYRSDNSTDVDQKNIATTVYICDIKPSEEWSMTFILARIFREIWLPAFIQFGQADNTDTVMVLKACELFLENCDSITKNAITLDIDKAFYEENLSDLSRIQATAGNRSLMHQVEQISAEWIRIIERILIRGKVIRRSAESTGPIDELEYWLQMHSIYSIAQELISTDTFEHHMKSLQLSASKLVNKWKTIENKLELANNEASENVQFLNSLERFQFPFYGQIKGIKNHVEPLFGALRTVYKTSTFYNTPNSMASFLSKCTNHLTMCCRNYIANGNTANIFLQPSEQLLERIFICLELLRAYRRAFDETTENIRAMGEPEWNFAEKYVFAQANLLTVRLSKLQTIIETDLKYSVLENILIENIQDFAIPISAAYDTITKRPYDHLDFSVEQFEEDFLQWQSTMDRVEKEMYRFVRAHINQFPTCPLIALNHLKRFHDLKFDCLRVNERYIDIVNAFVNDINALKDSFNLKRVAPVVPNLMCKYSGRICWARSIETKLIEVMSLLKLTDIFTEDKLITIQRTIKFHNALSKDLTLYEFQQYKAWFDQVHYVFDFLSQPVIRRNPSTNRLETNFNIMILNTIEEGKKMLKLHLDMPHLGQALVTYETDLRRKLSALKQLIEKNNDLRLSIPIVFVTIIRPQLQKIDRAFKPGIAQIQWLSKDFDDYIDNVDEALCIVSGLIQKARHQKIFHIEDIIFSMRELDLIVLGDEPTNLQSLLEENEEHRRKCGRVLETKSKMAEKATVELINLFIEHTDIPSSDKFDFISFEKLFQQVFVYNEGDHIEPLFKDYDELQYGSEQLHSDCMDLFNYFAHMILDGMIKSSRKSFDDIRTHFFHKEEPAALTAAKLDPSVSCYLSPNLDSMNETFLLLVHNITNIFKSVNAWGEQAIIQGSEKYKIDDINLQQGFLKNILGNKEIQRAIAKFDSGLSLLRPQIDSMLKDIYTKNAYLWNEQIGAELQELVNSDPYPSAIEDAFFKYQQILDDLQKKEKLIQINCIAIDLTEVYDAYIKQAKKWKKELAHQLATIYRGKFDEINDFIHDIECIVRRELKDEDDFMAAIECLMEVYQNGDRMESNLYKTTSTYAILEKYRESTGKVEKEAIDQLTPRYTEMFAHTKGVEVYIRSNFDEIMKLI